MKSASVNAMLLPVAIVLDAPLLFGELLPFVELEACFAFSIVTTGY